MPASSVTGVGTPAVLQLGTFSVSSHGISSVCVWRQRERERVRDLVTLPLIRMPDPLGLGPTLQLLCVLCLVMQLCPTLGDPMNCSCTPGSSVHGHSPGKNNGVGCHTLLQGNFPTQGWNSGVPHHRWVHYCLATRDAQEY